MTRALSAPLATEFQAKQLMPIALIELIFDSGAVRLWSGIGELVYAGNTYTGSGNLLSVSDYTEVQDLQARGMSVTLTGIPSTLISIALSENYQGRAAKIFIGALDDAGVLIGAPYQIFYGYMDNMAISESGETCSIAVALENRMITLTRSKELRYTAENQKTRFPNDKGLDFVSTLQDKEIVWKEK